MEYRPPRLIECNTESIRLIDTAALPETKLHNLRYAALSYCWGPSPTHLKLTTSNLSVLRQGLPMASLPVTFADAAQIACKLKVKYLWIDSLCIIQAGDGQQDWLRHISEMHNIYSNCVLQIAAAHAPTANGGCFSDIPQGATLPALIPQLRLEELGPGFLKTKPLESLSAVIPEIQPFAEFRLSSRGWVFQERLMAPRTVHFDHYNVYWECHAIAASALFPDGEKQFSADSSKLTYFNRPPFDLGNSNSNHIILKLPTSTYFKPTSKKPKVYFDITSQPSCISVPLPRQHRNAAFLSILHLMVVPLSRLGATYCKRFRRDKGTNEVMGYHVYKRNAPDISGLWFGMIVIYEVDNSAIGNITSFV